MIKLTDVQILIIKLALCVIALIGFGFWMYGAGQDDIQTKWNEETARETDARLVLVQKRAAEDAALVAKFNQINLDNSINHETALAKVNTALADARAHSRSLGGLRIQAPSCGITTPTEATGTGERDEASSTTVALPAEVEDGLWSIVGEADELTEQLRSCQGWIKSNGFYGKK